MAENVNSTQTTDTTPEIDYKAEYERVQGEYAKLKTSFDKASTDVSSYKKQLAEKQTDEERAKADAEEREARYKAIERENSYMKTRAKLSKTISDEKTLDKIANLYADGKVEEAIDQTTAYILASREEMRKEIEAELLKQNPQPSAQGSSAGAITKEQFDAMGVAEKTKLYREDYETYKRLTQQ